MSQNFGTVRQVGYVVRDIETAMSEWVKLGVGPWFYKSEVPSTEFRYYGKPSALPKLSIAFANSGDLQIELIQQRNEAPTLYLDTLALQGPSAQHLAYWTQDQFDAWCRTMLAQGWIEGHAGRMGAGRGRYAYFVNPRLRSAMVEISETSGGKGDFFDEIRKASIDWNGSDPVRHLPSVNS